MDWKLKTQINSGKLCINIRVNVGVEKLQGIVNTALDNVLLDFHGAHENKVIECFAPTYPKPTYRYS